jgi:hypothetical protein
MSRSAIRMLTPEQAASYREDWQAYLQTFLDQHEAEREQRRGPLQALLSYLRR